MRDRVWQDAIEGADAVGGDEEQVFTKVKDFADFAAGDFGDFGKIEGKKIHADEKRVAGRGKKGNEEVAREVETEDRISGSPDSNSVFCAMERDHGIR